MRLKYYTVVQKQSFRILRKDKKMSAKGMPKGNQHGSKIELWAFSGPISEVLGGFDRGRIFDEFLIGKKNEKNLER